MNQSHVNYDTIIKPSNGFIPIDFKELFRYRELFFFIAWRDIVIRYKQTAIGIAWAAIQPLMTMIVFSVIFGKLAKLPNEGIPYPILTFVGILPWQLFSTSLNNASLSVVSNSGMISKIYFPRLIIPVGSTIAAMVDFVIAFMILIGMMLWYQVIPTIHILFLPLFLLLALAAALGLGLWFAGLNVAYRDVKHMLPFILRLGIYISPVGFLSSTIPDKYQLLYSLNPLVGVIDGFRWCLLGGKITPNWHGLIMSTGIVCLILISGLYYFVKTEKTFADII